MCHVHKATAWISHATSGIVSARQSRLIQVILATLPRLRDQFNGRAQRNAINGRPRTSRGAATSIRISCCDMCAEKRTRPHACTGETSATKSASQPPAKHSASHVRIERRLRRYRPIANSTPVTTREMMTSGSKLHARARSCQLCGWPPWKATIGVTQRRKGRRKDVLCDLCVCLCAFA